MPFFYVQLFHNSSTQMCYLLYILIFSQLEEHAWVCIEIYTEILANIHKYIYKHFGVLPYVGRECVIIVNTLSSFTLGRKHVILLGNNKIAFGVGFCECMFHCEVGKNKLILN